MKKTLLLCISLLLLPSGTASAQGEPYAARRQALMETIGDGFAILFSGADPGRFNKSFYFLTGIKEPGSALALTPGGEVAEVLFTPNGEMDFEAGYPSARVHRMDQLGNRLSVYARGRETAYVSFGNIGSLPAVGRDLARLTTLKNVDPIVAEMRIIKDRQEIDFLRQACQITAEGLNEAFMAAKAGMQEKELAEILESAFHARNSPGSSFLQAASGPNATNVHFGAGERVLEDGDVVVFDVGAWWNDYTADISRTIPVSGTFSKEQREIYQVVLNSQKAAIDLMVPGATIDEVREIAQDVLIDGLHELGLVLDPADQAQRRFFIAHGYYHFIGLDIHDVWSEFTRSDGEKVYEAGMIMTMEPGLYFPEDRLELALARLESSPEDAEMRAFLEAIRPIYEKYVDIGVRIEDDVLITENGNEILTSAVPKEIADIEAMMGRSNQPQATSGIR